MLKTLSNRLHVLYFYLSIVIYKIICSTFKFRSCPRLGQDVCVHHYNVYDSDYALTFFTDSSTWEPEPYLRVCISGRDIEDGDLVVYETHGKKLVYRAFAAYVIDQANTLVTLDLLGIHGTDLYLTTMVLQEATLLDEVFDTCYYDEEALSLANLRENMQRPFL